MEPEAVRLSQTSALRDSGYQIRATIVKPPPHIPCDSVIVYGLNGRI